VLRVCSIDCLRRWVRIISAVTAGADLLTGAVTAVQHCLLLLLLLLVKLWLLLLVQHLFASTAGAVLCTAAAGAELEAGASALFVKCIYSLVWNLATASAKVS
jgi:hypothetical protein